MRFENRFLIYSFFIIFGLLFSLISFINYSEYKKEKHFVIDSMKRELEICSYKLNCKDVKVDFQKKSSKFSPFILHKDKNSFYMLFDESQIKHYFLKLSVSKNIYENKLRNIKNKILKRFLIELIFVLIVTFLFVYILLIPLKEAYKINETFIKDILHDFNTPITTLKLNLYLLKKELGKNEKIEKIEQSIKAILNYQENFKLFLSHNPNQIETFNIKDLIDEKLKFYFSSYPTIKYINQTDCKITINKQAFNSILDNLISNAFKYNKKGGKIEVFLKNKKLYIKDNGIGIKNPKKVFERFYKENERGVGIGMSIVKRLCDELKIDININSNENGTTIVLNLKKYC